LFFFRLNPLWMNSSITRLTITPTIALSSFSFPVDFADSLLKGIPHFFELGRPDHAQRTLPPILCHLFSLPDSHH
jgi:hypothetical protein